MHLHIFHSSNNTALKKSYGFLKGGQLGPEREFAGHQDPASPLKHVCRAWKPQGGPAVPQTLGRGTGSEACHSGVRVLPEKVQEGWQELSLGIPAAPPHPVNGHSTRVLRRCVCCQRPPHSCFAAALGDPLPRAAATFRTPGTAPMLGAWRGTEPKKAPPHRRWARHEARGKAQA